MTNSLLSYAAVAGRAALGAAAAVTLTACATQGTTTDASAAGARCEQTGSNLPRRECRSEVETLKPQAIESLKQANRPVNPGN